MNIEHEIEAARARIYAQIERDVAEFKRWSHGVKVTLTRSAGQSARWAKRRKSK